MADDGAFGSLPFQEQIDFFRRKLSMPTASWTDLWNEQHDHAFVVAGAMQANLVKDFRDAVDKAIAQGTTLEEFRKDFDAIVDMHGWTYNGGRNWRSRVIYDTNLRTSYAAGRWQQIQQVKQLRPYLRYRHMPGERYPRLQHLAWDGLVLPADHPFWRTHFPPNGWGCQCWVDSLSERDLTSKKLSVTPNDGVDDYVRARWAELQKSGQVSADEPAPIGLQTVTVGQNGPSPRTVQVPRGIDPGFGYAPGASIERSTEYVDLVQNTILKISQLPPDLAAQGLASLFSLPTVVDLLAKGAVVVDQALMQLAAEYAQRQNLP